MKYLSLLLFISALFWSCGNMPTDYNHWLVKKSDVEGVYNVNKRFAPMLNKQEKAIVSWYIYAYANECEPEKEMTWKCGLLEALRIDDECSQEHREYIAKHLGDDPIMHSKLQNCPVLPNDGAIQNLLQYMNIERRADTVIFSMRVAGMNNQEEKHWDIEVNDSYLLERKKVRKLN